MMKIHVPVRTVDPWTHKTNWVGGRSSRSIQYSCMLYKLQDGDAVHDSTRIVVVEFGYLPEGPHNGRTGQNRHQIEYDDGDAEPQLLLIDHYYYYKQKKCSIIKLNPEVILDEVDMENLDEGCRLFYLWLHTDLWINLHTHLCTHLHIHLHIGHLLNLVECFVFELLPLLAREFSISILLLLVVVVQGYTLLLQWELFEDDGTLLEDVGDGVVVDIEFREE